MEELLEEENPDTAIRALPEKTLKESPIIEPSPKIQEPEELSEDLIFPNQQPQEEFTPSIPIEDIFPKILNFLSYSR